MRIKMLTSVLGRTGLYRRGEAIDLPETEALRLIRRGLAIRTIQSHRGSKVEAAALDVPEETEAEPKPRRKRKDA